MTCETKAFTVVTGNSITILAYIDGVDQDAIVQADIASAAYVLTRVDDGEELSEGTTIASGSLTVSNVVFNTLQTTYGWPTRLGAGYNFRHTLSGVNFATQNSKYYYTLTLTDQAGLPNVVRVPLVTDNPVG
jgi:hypothetical protein